jgi:hypothetical protein
MVVVHWGRKVRGPRPLDPIGLAAYITIIDKLRTDGAHARYFERRFIAHCDRSARQNDFKLGTHNTLSVCNLSSPKNLVYFIIETLNFNVF